MSETAPMQIIVGFIVVETSGQHTHGKQVGRVFHARSAADDLCKLMTDRAEPGVVYHVTEKMGWAS